MQSCISRPLFPVAGLQREVASPVRLAALLLLAVYAGGCEKVMATDASCLASEQDNGYVKHLHCLSSDSHGHALRVEAKVVLTLSFDGRFATVFNPDHGWMYVRSDGVVVAEGVMSMDNGADYIEDGFVRYARNGKCGYTNLDGKPSIAAKFDGCLPFSHGHAQVCEGCRQVREDEYGTYRGGTRYCIDDHGKPSGETCLP